MDENNNINDKSQNYISTINTFLRYFCLTVIIFLVMSFISNKYVPGLGMNFLPMFITAGSSFFPKPVLTNIFHPPVKIDNSNNNFFQKETMTSGSQSEEKTYYELLQLGGTFTSIFLGKNQPVFSRIYIQDYDNLYWYQKIIMSLFGAIQILIGCTTTLFSCFAYLFSGKDGYFLSLPQAKSDLEANGQNLFEDPGISTIDSKSDKIILKSGWDKFSAFFNYIFFIPVDKLTFGSTFFLEKSHGSFMDRFKYFFLLLFIFTLFTMVSSSFDPTGSAGIVMAVITSIILFILFGLRILNPNHNADPLPNYNAILENTKYYLKDPNLSFNDLINKITKLQATIKKSVADYKKSTLQVAEQIGEKPSMYGGKYLKKKHEIKKN